MEVEKTGLEGCYVVKPKVFKDTRGYFFESFHQSRFKELTGLDVNFVQDNQSYSSRGVLRGLHFQRGDAVQAKLVRVIKGAVLDVVVDLRKESKTYGQHFSIRLDDKDHYQLFVPRGFAHGFLVLEDHTVFSYKCDNYYHAASESGIRYNDPSLNINWEFSESDLIISDKDLKLPFFNNLIEPTF